MQVNLYTKGLQFHCFYVASLETFYNLMEMGSIFKAEPQILLYLPEISRRISLNTQCFFK